MHFQSYKDSLGMKMQYLGYDVGTLQFWSQIMTSDQKNLLGQIFVQIDALWGRGMSLAYLRDDLLCRHMFLRIFYTLLP